MIDRQSVDHDWALHISSAMHVTQTPTNQYLQYTLREKCKGALMMNPVLEEQCVTASMGSLNRIAPDNSEVLLSSDSLSSLMALKKACMCSNLTARHGVLTKEAGALGVATFHIQQMCARGDFGIMHEAAFYSREKNETTDFSQTVTARQNHACDLLAGAAG